MLETVLELLSAIPDLDIRKNEPMSAHTSFRIGGPAKFFLEAKSQDAAEVVVWGSGCPLREFMYADDLGDACLFLK